MSYYLKLGFILLLIAAVASGVLAFVNGFTKPIIEENRRLAEIEARQEVLPVAVDFQKAESEFEFYIGYDAAGDIVGYTFLAEKTGYSGPIQTMVGVGPELKIINIKVVEQSETPGLGANCVRSEFTDQFSDLEEEELYIDKDGGEIVSITGATITSRALVDSLREAIQMLQENLEHEIGEEVL